MKTKVKAGTIIAVAAAGALLYWLATRSSPSNNRNANVNANANAPLQLTPGAAQTGSATPGSVGSIQQGNTAFGGTNLGTPNPADVVV